MPRVTWAAASPPEMPRAVLVDGFVAATWKVVAKRDTAMLTVRPFRRLTAAEQEEIAAEGTRLLAFTAAKATTREIVFEVPRPG